MTKTNKDASKTSKNINWSKGFAITGWIIIALGIAFAAGFFQGQSSAQTPTQTVQAPKV